MSKNNDKIKELEDRKASIEANIEIEDHDIDRIGKLCLKQGVTKTILNKFKKAEQALCDLDISEEDRALNSAAVNDYIKAFPCLNDLVDPIQQKESLKWDLEVVNADLKPLKSDASKTVQEIYEETAETVEQEGHLYPVKLVSTATAKLREYNKQIDDFVAGIDSLDVNVDISWLCQKIEAFCRRINYALALLRHQIIKGLSKIFEQANVYQKYIDPIANFNPTDIFSCLGWVKNVIKYFLGPYLIIIQFISDFMTYTPPLIAEATKLTANVATLPARLMSKVDITVQTKKASSEPSAVSQAIDNEVSGTPVSSSAIQEELANAYKEEFKLEMEPISLGDVIGGGSEEPEYPESSTKAKQRDLYEKQNDNNQQSADGIWDKMSARIKRIPYECPLIKGKAIDVLPSSNVHSDFYHAIMYPAKVQKLSNDFGCFYYIAALDLTEKIDLNYSNALTPGQAAEQIGFKFKGDICLDTNSSIPSRFNVYRAVILPTFPKLFEENEKEIKENITAYYKESYAKIPDPVKLDRLRCWETFLRFFGTYDGCDFIYFSLVEDYQNAIMSLVKTEAKVEELDNPTVFD